MKYFSVCSGIEAATVAWHHLGWKPTAFAEVELFPSAVLAHHYPSVCNRGDMTSYQEWPDETVDLLVGGTPCQSFSVAGLRQGLKDPRGNLMLVYLAIAASRRPKWIVWENVPGVLSSNGGKDFGTFLGALGELGYGFAYRVLDAQWFGVAQRRRRVFVVGCLGEAGSAAKVLFERESVSRNPAPSREAGQKVAATLTGGFGERGVDADQIANGNYEVAACLRSGGNGGVPSSKGEHLVVGSLDTECGAGKLTHQTIANGHIIGTITARMFSSLGARDVEEGALLPVAFQQNTRNEVRLINGDGAIVGALQAMSGMKQTNYIASGNQKQVQTPNCKISGSLRANPGSGFRSDGTPVEPVVITPMAVRRLTPIECERLQGFPDNYTQIPYRNKLAENCPEGPRYKALGNSMAVPVMRWIGERINKVSKESA